MSPLNYKSVNIEQTKMMLTIEMLNIKWGRADPGDNRRVNVFYYR